VLLEELNGDLWGNLVDSVPNFFSRISQPVRVDVDSYVTSWTAHVLVRFKIPYRLGEFVTALRTLKSDHMCVNGGHYH
jgi:hypothetical protein